jgi:tRNA pseudouridine55 synthase
MDGLLNFFKPRGITSAKALYRLRKILGQRKSGHAGTLDPAADGVLLICLGRGTKRVEQLMDLPKVYQTTMRLDVTSASFDAETAFEEVPVQRPPSRDEVAAALASFVGVCQQVPPATSAIKIGGRPAYKLARQGVAPTLSARSVRIYEMRLLAYTWPELEIEVACGRGTYVRALARDLGAKLQTGGCLTALRRLAVGPFDVDTAWTFERLEVLTAPADAVLALERVDELIAGYPRPAQD